MSVASRKRLPIVNSAAYSEPMARSFASMSSDTNTAENQPAMVLWKWAQMSKRAMPSVP